ncbi:MAG: hypothetical protein ACREMP_06610, partial [Candidatus Tyrphobacter sp.]
LSGMLRSLTTLAAVAAIFALSGAAAPTTSIWLPTGWRISKPTGIVHTVGLFPQGIALSPNGSRLAVVDSGDAPPALLILDARTLAQRLSIALAGAFGRPVWLDGSHVLVAGANDDCIENVDVSNGTVSRIAVAKGSWPAQVAISPDRKYAAVSDDFTSSLTIVALRSGALLRTVRVGIHPDDVVFARDGSFVYVALRGERRVAAVKVSDGAVRFIDVGLHPAALALSKDGSLLYVAESDDDALGIVDLRSRRRIADVDLSLHAGRTSGYGASPNAIAIGARNVYVSLGQENAIAVVRDRRLLGRMPVGWYPSGVALAANGRLYVSDADGESSPANPNYDPYGRGPHVGYTGASLRGSIRILNAHALDTAQVIQNASQDWMAPAHTIVRPDGPITHVIYIIKENRTYD